jgi:hypothetical protein
MSYACYEFLHRKIGEGWVVEFSLFYNHNKSMMVLFSTIISLQPSIKPPTAKLLPHSHITENIA